MPAKEGDTVKVHYTGKLTDGTEFDSSRGRDPLEFTLGQGQMIPGFESLVVGMEKGETKEDTITSEEAYGPRRDDLIRVVDPEQFPDDFEPEEGERIRIQPPQGGQPIDAVVAEIGDAEVKLDMNHPLAGEDLVFEVELVEIG